MTNAEFAILSLIVEKPRHGYEIEQVIEARGMRNWTEVGFSSIYYLLKKLETLGLVTSHSQITVGRGPARKVFTATDAGNVACQAATLEALRTPHRCYPPIQLGLSNLPIVSTEQTTDALQQHLDGLLERRAAIELSRDEAPHPTNAAMMFAYSLAVVTARIEWLQHTIQQLENKSHEDN